MGTHFYAILEQTVRAHITTTFTLSSVFALLCFVVPDMARALFLPAASDCERRLLREPWPGHSDSECAPQPVPTHLDRPGPRLHCHRPGDARHLVTDHSAHCNWSGSDRGEVLFPVFCVSYASLMNPLWNILGRLTWARLQLQEQRYPFLLVVWLPVFWIF